MRITGSEGAPGTRRPRSDVSRSRYVLAAQAVNAVSGGSQRSPPCESYRCSKTQIRDYLLLEAGPDCTHQPWSLSPHLPVDGALAVLGLSSIRPSVAGAGGGGDSLLRVMSQHWAWAASCPHQKAFLGLERGRGSSHDA